MEEKTDDMISLMNAALKDMPVSNNSRDQNGKRKMPQVETISCGPRYPEENK